jgi:WD40 repeat protein
MDDAELAAWFSSRLRGLAPEVLSAQGQEWRMDAVNERVRFCRYGAGQRFNIHQDGVHHRSAEYRSLLTFMIYLTDGEAFSGGDTEFYAEGPRGAGDVVARVRPRVGSLILFDHAIWHAGAEVTAGIKHVVRSDVLYRRVGVAAGEGDSGGHRGYVWALASLGEGRIASGGRDGCIRVWDGGTHPSRVMSGHTQSVLGLARLDGGSLASVSRDGTLRVWDLRTGRCEHCLLAHDAAVLTVADLGHGRIATGSADGSVKIWTHEGLPIGTLAAHAGWVWKLVRVSDEVFASVSEDGCVRLWHCGTLPKEALVRSDRTQHFPLGTRHHGVAQALDTPLCMELPGEVPLRAAAVSPDGARLATGDVTGCVRIWEVFLTQPRMVSAYAAHDAAVRCLAFLDADTLVSGGEDYRVRLWNGRPVSHAEHRNFVTDIAVLDKGRYASCSYDGEIRVHAA